MTKILSEMVTFLKKKDQCIITVYLYIKKKNLLLCLKHKAKGGAYFGLYINTKIYFILEISLLFTISYTHLIKLKIFRTTSKFLNRTRC